MNVQIFAIRNFLRATCNTDSTLQRVAMLRWMKNCNATQRQSIDDVAVLHFIGGLLFSICNLLRVCPGKKERAIFCV